MEPHDSNSKSTMGSTAHYPLDHMIEQQFPQHAPLNHPQPLQQHLQLQQQHQQSLTDQSSTPPRQYTTVGSVYNPQPQPLQPPVRRGRTVKTLFPYKSESPGPSQLHYTPLQQNSDRAVSPVRISFDTLPSTMVVNRLERQILQKFGAIPNMPEPLQSPISGGANVGHLNGDASTTRSDLPLDLLATDSTATISNTIAPSDNESDEAYTKPISAMNFNSLTNLASYPNPMQRAAQKVLASHRPQLNTGSGSQFSNTETEPWVSPVEPSMPMPHGTKVRGVPAPLTAGPPGVRQFRPTTFDQETLQRVREFDDENPMMNPYHHRPHSVQTSRSPFMERESMFSMPSRGILSDDDFDDVDDDFDDDYEDEGEGHKRGKKKALVVDTLPLDKVREFYPLGLPRNFNSCPEPVSVNWELERLSKVNPQSEWYGARNHAEFVSDRRQRINNLFYAGSNMFNKTFDAAVSENNRRVLTHTVGHPYMEPPNNQGKVTNRPISVRDASMIPACEHAVPLLSMAFQAIARHPNFSPYSTLPKFEQSLYPPYLRK